MSETMRRVTGAETEAAGDAEPQDPAGLGYEPRTELDRLILAARREFLAANGRFLTREELEREVAGVAGRTCWTTSEAKRDPDLRRLRRVDRGSS